MRRVLVLWVLMASAAARAASPLYVSPDVPTGTPAAVFPWQVHRYDAAGPSYTAVLTVPGSPVVDAIHKRDAIGAWLFSLDAASDLGGALAATAEPRDVVLFDGATYSRFFCGGLAGVPPGSDVDAIYQDGDGGDLVVSFDVPTTIGSTTYDPADLVAFARTGAGCGGWTVGSTAFDASAVGIPISSNTIGADRAGTKLVLTFNVPTDVTPPAFTALPRQVVAYETSTATWSVYETLTSWPLSSRIDGLSLLANPGTVPTTIRVAKSTITPGNLRITWSASCSQGAEDYAIYEGTIVTPWTYNHTSLDCSDAGGDLAEEITPGTGRRYYLVVPHHQAAEGSYGVRSGSIQRPVGTAVCASPQIVTLCP